MERQKTKKTKSTDRGEVPLSSDQIAALAKECIPSWIESGRIPKPPVELSDEVYAPSIPSRGHQFYMVCGKHKKFTSLTGYVQASHEEFAERWEIQVLERQVVLRERYLAANPQMQFKQLERMDQAGPSAQGASTSFPSV
ncbi:hypothetical protein OSTOST_10496 [Ostertagia ostertagi]